MQLRSGDVRVAAGWNRPVFLRALRTADVEFDSMSDDAAANLVAYEAEDTLNRARVELADGAARNANRVMVMLRVGERIARLSVDEAQLADDPRLQQQLDGAKDGGAADMRQITHQVFSSEPIGSLFEVLNNLSAG